MNNYLTEVQSRLALFKWGGSALLILGIFVAVWLMVRSVDGLPYRYYLKYVAYLERQLQRQFNWTPGDNIVIGQFVALFLILAATLLVGLNPLVFMLLMAAAIGGPPLHIERERLKRVRRIEGQLDGFLVAMSNALKATPSIGDAFMSTETLVLPPLKEEIGLAVKEMRVGSSLDDALRVMATRIGSRQVDSALSALLVGRQVGGNLPEILDTTADTLREMARLDAIVRSKTAEGKAQVMLLSAFPVFLIFAFSAVSDDYFEPLTTTVPGYVVTFLAVACWASSIILARRIMAMNL